MPSNRLEYHLNKVRVTQDCILCVCPCVELSLGRGMTFSVVVPGHLCLTLSDILDEDRTIYLVKLVSDESLFQQSLKAKSELRKKQTEAVSPNLILNPNCP